MALNIFFPEFHGTLIEKVNPLVKLLYLIFFSVIVSDTSYPFLTFISIFIFSLFWKIRLIRKTFKTPAIVILSLLIVSTDLLNGFSLFHSLQEGIRLISLFSLAIIFTSTTETVDLATAISAFVYKISGKNIFSFSSSVMLIFAFLSEVFRISRVIMDARKARSGSFIRHPIKSLSEFSLCFFSNIINSASVFSDALSSRLYDKNNKRSSPNYSKIDYFLLFSLLFFVFILLFVHLGNIYG